MGIGHRVKSVRSFISSLLEEGGWAGSLEERERFLEESEWVRLLETKDSAVVCTLHEFEFILSREIVVMQ